MSRRSRSGSASALTAGRPGSWEADLVQQLVKVTVGCDEELLKQCGERVS
jgi:hypothetical protein